jgi:hypothetical protein
MTAGMVEKRRNPRISYVRERTIKEDRNKLIDRNIPITLDILEPSSD